MPKFTCGQFIREYRWAHECKRLATYVDAERIDLRDLYCNVHAAGNRRAKYGQRTLIPLDSLPEAKLQVLVAELQERTAAAAQRRAEKDDQHHQQLRAVMFRNWTDELQERTTSAHDGEDWNHDARAWDIYPAGDERNREHKVAVETYDYEYSDVVMPASVSWSGSGSMTAKSARAVAHALLKAADLADEVNKARRVNAGLGS